MQNPFDINANATNAVVGGQSSSDAMGFPAANPPAGLRSTPRALQESRDRLLQAQAEATPAPGAAPPAVVGYNPETKRLFSGGREFDNDNLADLYRAQQTGALDIDNSGKLPPGFVPIEAGQVKQKLAATPDWKKELGSSLRSYGANMALLGGAITGSEGMLNTYGRLKGESDLLSGESAAPKSFDEVEFGENMLPYIRQLGIGSAPYMAEAIVTGFGIGSALKGAGTAAAKQLAERAILRETERILARGTTQGVAAISREQALLQAGQRVGTSFARAAGVGVGTYPSAAGDILSNQMEQSGEIDPTSAALLAVPYAGLNLLGAEGLVAGTGRALQRGLGSTGLGSRAARAGAAAGLTTAGEAVNETGQEVVNQMGRMVVDPNASLTSDDALARYKEAAIGGALLGGAAGAGAGVGAAVRPPEAAVTPQMLDANRDAEQARYETEYARDQIPAEQAIGTGGDSFSGPNQPLALATLAQVATKTVADPQVEAAIDALLNDVNPALLGSKKARTIASELVTSGLSADPAGDAVREALSNNKFKKAEALLRIAKEGLARGTALPTAGVDSGAAGQPGVEPGGSAPAGQPDAGVGVVDGGIRDGAAGAESADGAGVPVGAAGAPERAVIPDFSLESYGPEEGPLAPQSQTAREAALPLEPTPTDNLRAKEQMPLWVLPSGRRKVDLKAPGAKVAIKPRAAAVQAAPRQGTAQQIWDRIKPKEAPNYNRLPEELQAELTSMHASGILNKGELAKRQNEAAAVDKAAKMAKQKEVDTARTAEETKIASDPKMEALRAAFPGREAAVMYRAFVSGDSLKDIARATNIGDSMVGKIVRMTDAKIKKSLDAAVKAGKLDRATADSLAKMMSKKTTAARKNAAANVDQEAEVDQAPDEGVEQGRVAPALDQGDETVDAVADETDPGAARTDLPGGTDSIISSDTSAENAGTKPKLSDAEVNKIADKRERASVWTARATQRLDQADALQDELDNDAVDASKRDDVKDQIEMLQNEAGMYFKRAEDTLKSLKGEIVPTRDVAEKEDDTEVEPELDGRLYGKSAAPAGKSTAKSLTAEILAFMGLDKLPGTITIVDTAEDLPSGRDRIIALGDSRAFGWTQGNQVVLIADRIAPGRGAAKFMHEVGAHLGLDNILGARERQALFDSVRRWADNDDGSVENKLALRALGRVVLAGTPDKDVQSEVIAYFVEEAVTAGIKPTNPKGKVALFLNRVYVKFMAALQALRMAPKSFTPQHLVDMAYGAAHMQLDDAMAVESKTPGLRFGKNSITAKLPTPLQNTSLEIGETLKAWGQTALNTTAFTEDLISRAITKGMGAAKAYREATNRRATKAGERLEAANKIMAPFLDLTTAQQKAVNEYLYNSTREGKWGFTPAWMKPNGPVDAAMKGQFDRLSASSQALVKSIFKHGSDILDAKQALVRTTVGQEFDADIAAAKAAKNTKLAEELQSTKDAMLARFATLFRLQQGSPYTPLRRTGDWLVVGKSAEYKAAEDAGDRAELSTLETDPDHYSVNFVDSETEARQLDAQLRAEGMNTTYRPKEAMLEQLYGGQGMMGAFLKIKNQVQQLQEGATSEEDTKRLSSLNRVVTGMYLNALGEASARKAELRRRGIAGKIDMIKGFTTQARADAQFMASVEYNDQVLKSIKQMRKEATTGDGQAAKMKLFNELMRRYVGTVDAVEQKAADRITRATSIWMLATSPAYYLTNATQPFVISVPYMAKQHSYTESANALLKAWGQVAKMVGNVNWKHNLDFDQVPADARDAMENLVKLGIIDIGMNSEMGSFHVGSQNRIGKFISNMDERLQMISQKVEAVNRLSTAIAAYRLELARTGNKAAAEDYAGKVVTQTHGDYSRANAPRVFNTGLGRIALQFRKFQLIQITLMGKLLKESMSGLNTAEAWAARRAMAYVFAHMGVLGGLVSMPGYALWSALAGAIGGDDGPDDMEQKMRAAIGNQKLADLILRGAPAAGGVDVSGKIGMTNMLSVLPFTDINFTRQGVAEVGFALTTGAAGSLAMRGADGYKYMKQGDYYRGVETLMPSGLLNAMKAGRLATQGATNPKGDMLINPSEVATIDTLAQALGFTPTQTSRRQALQSYSYDVGTYFRERSDQLKMRYVRAVRNGEPTAGILADWRAMQENQRARGVQIAPLGNLYKAPAEVNRRERQTAGGVQYQRGNKLLVVEGAAD